MTEVAAARQRLSEDDSTLLHENAAVLVENTIAPELKDQLGKPIGVLRIGDKNFLIHPANVHGRLLAPTTNEEIRGKTRYWPDEVQNAYKVHRDSEPIVASAELAAVDVVKTHAYHNGHSQITARITCTDAVTGQPRSIRISDEELYSLFFERPKGVADIADFDVIETTGHPLLSIVLKHDTDPTIIVFNSSFTTSTESAYSPKLVATQFLEHLHKGLLQEASQLQLDTIAAIERAEEREQIAYQGKELGTAQQQQYKFLLALYKVKALLLAGKASAPDDPWVNEFVPFLKDKDQSLFRKLMNLFFGHKTWQLSDKLLTELLRHDQAALSVSPIPPELQQPIRDQLGQDERKRRLSMPPSAPVRAEVRIDKQTQYQPADLASPVRAEIQSRSRVEHSPPDLGIPARPKEKDQSLSEFERQALKEQIVNLNSLLLDIQEWHNTDSVFNLTEKTHGEYQEQLAKLQQFVEAIERTTKRTSHKSSRTKTPALTVNKSYFKGMLLSFGLESEDLIHAIPTETNMQKLGSEMSLQSLLDYVRDKYLLLNPLAKTREFLPVDMSFREFNSQVYSERDPYLSLLRSVLYDAVNLAASISGSSDRLYADVPILLLTDIVLKQQIISVYSALFRAIQYQLSHTSDSHPHLATILSELSTQLTTLIELEKSTTKRQQEVRHIR